MRIIDCTRSSALNCALPAHPVSGPAPAAVAVEHWMEIWINGRGEQRVICTPEHLDELAAGHLLTEGLIRQADDIEEIRIEEDGKRALVLARRKAETDTQPVIGTCGAENRILPAASRVAPVPWRRDALLRIAERMKEEEPLYGATHAVHACYLAQEDKILCCREDMGRHNAMDKAIGWAVIQGIDLSRCALFTTGRMPSDMVSKAARCGVPVLASKTYPSDRGILLAEQAGLSLITVRPGGNLIVWNDGMRAAD